MHYNNQKPNEHLPLQPESISYVKAESESMASDETMCPGYSLSENDSEREMRSDGKMDNENCMKMSPCGVCECESQTCRKQKSTYLSGRCDMKDENKKSIENEFNSNNELCPGMSSYDLINSHEKIKNNFIAGEIANLRLNYKKNVDGPVISNNVSRQKQFYKKFEYQNNDTYFNDNKYYNNDKHNNELLVNYKFQEIHTEVNANVENNNLVIKKNINVPLKEYQAKNEKGIKQLIYDNSRNLDLKKNTGITDNEHDINEYEYSGNNNVVNINNNLNKNAFKIYQSEKSIDFQDHNSFLQDASSIILVEDESNSFESIYNQKPFKNYDFEMPDFRYNFKDKYFFIKDLEKWISMNTINGKNTLSSQLLNNNNPFFNNKAADDNGFEESKDKILNRNQELILKKFYCAEINEQNENLHKDKITHLNEKENIDHCDKKYCNTNTDERTVKKDSCKDKINTDKHFDITKFDDTNRISCSDDVTNSTDQYHKIKNNKITQNEIENSKNYDIRNVKSKYNNEHIDTSNTSNMNNEYNAINEYIVINEKNNKKNECIINNCKTGLDNDYNNIIKNVYCNNKPYDNFGYNLNNEYNHINEYNKILENSINNDYNRINENSNNNEYAVNNHYANNNEYKTKDNYGIIGKHENCIKENQDLYKDSIYKTKKKLNEKYRKNILHDQNLQAEKEKDLKIFNDKEIDILHKKNNIKNDSDDKFYNDQVHENASDEVSDFFDVQNQRRLNEPESYKKELARILAKEALNKTIKNKNTSYIKTNINNHKTSDEVDCKINESKNVYIEIKEHEINNQNHMINNINDYKESFVVIKDRNSKLNDETEYKNSDYKNEKNNENINFYKKYNEEDNYNINDNKYDETYNNCCDDYNNNNIDEHKINEEQLRINKLSSDFRVRKSFENENKTGSFVSNKKFINLNHISSSKTNENNKNTENNDFITPKKKLENKLNLQTRIYSPGKLIKKTPTIKLIHYLPAYNYAKECSVFIFEIKSNKTWIVSKSINDLKSIYNIKSMKDPTKIHKRNDDMVSKINSYIFEAYKNEKLSSLQYFLLTGIITNYKIMSEFLCIKVKMIGYVWVKIKIMGSIMVLYENGKIVKLFNLNKYDAIYVSEDCENAFVMSRNGKKETFWCGNVVERNEWVYFLKK
ncbi:hypothetical protein COBT_000267 [Conglomerata obtusa]